MTVQHSDTMGVYNALDAANTLAISNEIYTAISNDPQLKKQYDFTMELHNPLMYMMSRGMRINSAALKETKVEINKKID